MKNILAILICLGLITPPGWAGNSAPSNISNATTQAPPDTTDPTVPSGVTVTTASTTQLNLSWTASTDTGGSGLAGYKVYRAGTLVSTTATTSYSDTGRTAGTQYCYTVTAYDNAGNESSASTSTCGTTAPPVPANPTTLTATATSTTQINLTWVDASSNETGFKIERASSSGGSYSQIATVGAGVTTYANTGLSASTAYYYRVRATNATGDSGYTSVASATTQAPPDTTDPTVPGGVTVTTVSTTQLNLSWTAATDSGGSGLAGYKVYRAGTLVGTTVTASYSDTGRTAGTQYCYTITAYDNAGNESTSSTSVCGTTTPNPPAAPSGLTSVAMSSSEIDLQWTDNSGNEVGFIIERAPSAGGPWTQINTTGASVTTYKDLGLNSQTTYYYRVSSFN